MNQTTLDTSANDTASSDATRDLTIDADHTEALQRQRVLDEAHRWLGTPYHHQGRVRGVGVDCATLLCEVYHAAGVVPYIDPTPYPPDWHLHRSDERYLGWLYDYASPVEQPQAGDVAVWKFGRCYSHGAVVIGENTIIHSYLKQGCVLADMQQHPLKDRPVLYFSLWKKDPTGLATAPQSTLPNAPHGIAQGITKGVTDTLTQELTQGVSNQVTLGLPSVLTQGLRHATTEGVAA